MKQYIPLSRVISKASVERCGDRQLPILSITMKDGLVLQDEKFKKRIASADTSDYKVILRGKLVQGIHIDEANFGIQDIVDEGIVSPAYKVWEVDSSIIFPKYLEMIMRSPRSLSFYRSKLNGSVNRRGRMTDDDFLAMPIPFVNYEQQKRVVSIIHQASSLIAMYSRQLLVLDTLVKARFVEMFGDPVLNPKSFPVYRMDEVVEFQGGSQPDKKYFEYEPTSDNIRLIQIRDYKTDKYITYIPKALAKRHCTADDIMIGRYGPPIFQILQGIEGSFNVALMKATPKVGNREFIRWFLKQDCLLRYLEGLSQRTAGQDGIQMDKLNAYPFPMPPVSLQEEFELLVHQVDKSKLSIQ
ncbi:MAG: restriction endonuclease subunit S [Clostridia bacterium]|nr:restriction endonuclease subunit S [Clostridia bacterium]